MKRYCRGSVFVIHLIDERSSMNSWTSCGKTSGRTRQHQSTRSTRIWSTANPRLANLSAEELASLDCLTRKLVTAAEDGPHSQIESKPEIEAVDSVEVASEQSESL